jgi:acylphosphatase
MLKQAHIYIKGDIIGVGFRAWTKIQAKIVGVSGWVRNNEDGFVETVIQGDEDKVNVMVETLKQGPPVARVDDVEVIWIEPKEMLEGFEIKK